MATVTEHGFSIRQMYPDNTRHYEITKGDAIIGWLHWREWIRDREGYQFHPATTARRESRILRPDLFEALTKAVRLKPPVARYLVQQAAE